MMRLPYNTIASCPCHFPLERRRTRHGKIPGRFFGFCPGLSSIGGIPAQGYPPVCSWKALSGGGVPGALWGSVAECVCGAKGMVAARKFSAEGRSMGALRLMHGQSFWSPTIFDGNPLPASLEARADSDIYLWRQEDLFPFVRQSPDALWDLCALLISRIRQASEIVEDLAFQSVNSRLAGLLYKQYHENKDVHIPRTLTLDEMAGIIGTTPVMVCKILSHFAASGLIAVKRTEFEVADLDALKEMAGRGK